MNGLRVYVNSTATDQAATPDVFYSRRGDGPYYRWRYEEDIGGWRVSRVYVSGLTLRALCVASWKAVPPALRAKLSEHYLE